MNSCAVVGLVYPRPVMMVGRNREKLCNYFVSMNMPEGSLVLGGPG